MRHTDDSTGIPQFYQTTRMEVTNENQSQPMHNSSSPTTEAVFTASPNGIIWTTTNEPKSESVEREGHNQRSNLQIESPPLQSKRATNLEPIN